MPRILKRLPIPKYWYRDAECRYYEAEMFDPKSEDADIAEAICTQVCSVREFCVRATFREEVAEGNLSTTNVIRGGVHFTGAARTLCTVCGLAVATGKRGICNVCRDYDACKMGCGRLVPKDGDQELCLHCQCLTTSGKEAEAA